MIEGRFNFDTEDPIYRDHFPGHAVVPGSLIVHAFMAAAARMGAAPASWQITNFRFRRFVVPGCYAYSIAKADSGRLACTLFHNDEVVVTGTL